MPNTVYKKGSLRVLTLEGRSDCIAFWVRGQAYPLTPDEFREMVKAVEREIFLKGGINDNTE